MTRLLAALGFALAAACSQPEPRPEPAAAPAPPPAAVSARGEVVIEPPSLVLAGTAVVEVAIVTPPDWRVPALAAPTEVPGFWILGADVPAVERSPQRWVHRTRFEVRARRTGRFMWPGTTLWLEDAEGRPQLLEIEERFVEVVSVARELPDRVDPFDAWRSPGLPVPSRGALLPAAIGALGALAVVGLAVLVRRARARDARAMVPEDAGAGVPGGRAALAALDAALAEPDPRAAADRASSALRLFVTQRHGVPADCATTEELAALEAPFALTRRWAPLLGLLRQLDDLRFRPPPAAPDAARDAALRAVVEAARAWVGESLPRSELMR